MYASLRTTLEFSNFTQFWREHARPPKIFAGTLRLLKRIQNRNFSQNDFKSPPFLLSESLDSLPEEDCSVAQFEAVKMLMRVSQSENRRKYKRGLKRRGNWILQRCSYIPPSRFSFAHSSARTSVTDHYPSCTDAKNQGKNPLSKSA